MEEITKKQWKAYKRVQEGGLYNMLTPDAVRDSGLDKDIYFSIIKHYSELEEKFEGADHVDDE